VGKTMPTANFSPPVVSVGVAWAQAPKIIEAMISIEKVKTNDFFILFTPLYFHFLFFSKD
jgi:hypothetical protein